MLNISALVAFGLPCFFSFPSWPVLTSDHALRHTFSRSTCKAIINNPQLLIMRWQQCAIKQWLANEFQQIQNVCVSLEERVGWYEWKRHSCFCLSLQEFFVFSFIVLPPIWRMAGGLNDHCTHCVQALVSANMRMSKRHGYSSQWNRDSYPESPF